MAKTCEFVVLLPLMHTETQAGVQVTLPYRLRIRAETYSVTQENFLLFRNGSESVALIKQWVSVFDGSLCILECAI